MVAETAGEVQDVGGLQQGGVWQLTQAGVVSSENLWYCDLYSVRRRKRVTLPKTLWMICFLMRRRSMVLDVSACSCAVAGCLCSSLLCQLNPCLFLCACSAPPAQQCSGSCPARRL